MQIIFRRDTALVVVQNGNKHRRTFLLGEIITVEVERVNYDRIEFKYIDGAAVVNNSDFAILL